jgi:rubrerythrin
VLADPRTNLLQSLEAILVAELADNECWTALETLARQAGHEDLANGCRRAVEHEREHLRDVRRWVAAGQGREMGDGGAPMAEEAEEEFTFAADSPVDREGYVVSDEEAAEGEAKPPRSTGGKSRGRRSPRSRGTGGSGAGRA